MKPEQFNILQAARSNNYEYIRSMAQTHFDFELHDFKDQNGNTPLWVAAVNKNVEAVRALIKSGADVNVRCENGNTILHRLMLNKDTDPESIRDMRNE